MKFTATLQILILSLLSSVTAQQWAITGMVSTTPCLDTAESYLIALRWLQIFQTDVNGTGTGAALVSSTLAKNFTYYDEGASFGKVGPVYESAKEVETAVSGFVFWRREEYVSREYMLMSVQVWIQWITGHPCPVFDFDNIRIMRYCGCKMAERFRQCEVEGSVSETLFQSSLNHANRECFCSTVDVG